MNTIRPTRTTIALAPAKSRWARVRRCVWALSPKPLRPSLFAFLALAAVFAGCGGKSAAPESAAPAPLPTTLNPGGKPVDAASAGSISGKILLDGAPPKLKIINMAAAAPCKKQHADNHGDDRGGGSRRRRHAAECGGVYLQGDFSAYSFAVPQTPAALDQSGRQFLQPHVVALMVGQPLDVTSTDKTSHNVNAMAKNNAVWNHTQLAQRAALPKQAFAHAEVAIPVKCNIHPWMKAYIAVLDSPYFAVTGPDGSFALKNVPLGTYTLTAWQETYGSTEQSITVAPNESKPVTLSFKSAS